MTAVAAIIVTVLVPFMAFNWLRKRFGRGR